MKQRRYWVGALAALAVVGGVLAAVRTAVPSKHASPKLTKLTFQLKGVTQAQFAGYYAADAKGFYKKAGLDVKIRVGGPDIIPEQVVAGGQAQLGLDWLPSLMSARDQGTKLVNIAQVFARSGMTEITWKNSHIDTIAKMHGKKVGKRLLGTESWLKDKKNQATAKKFLVASFKGWIYCRTHLRDCVRIVLSHGPTLLKGHQTWQMNEINALVWPSPLGIGLMNTKDYKFTARTTAKYNHLKRVPGHEAYRTDLAKAAQATLKKQHYDIYGKSCKKANVKVTPGGN